MHAALLLTLPLLAYGYPKPHAHAHGIRAPSHPHLAAPAEVYVPRNGHNAHLGFPPADRDSVLAVAGMRRVALLSETGRKRNGRKAKRACKAQGTLAVGSNMNSTMPSASAVQNLPSASAVQNQTASSVSSAAAEATSPATNTSTTPNTSSMMRSLFPAGTGSADWTTCTEGDSAMTFTDALKPLTAGKLPSTANAPDGSNALVANYPANTFQYSSSTGAGYSFYTAGEHNNVVTSGAKEVMFSYSIFFPDGFQFVKGGKLPGLYGGTDLDTAKSCSGGRQDSRDECFSARLMWRTNGMGEFYNYYPAKAYDSAGYCDTAPQSVCDGTYGDSIGRGAFTFSTGQWTVVAQRLKLNDVGQANGEQELFVNGKSILNLSGLTISVNDNTKIYGIMAQTFFGGSDSSWASPVDQSAYFKDWSLAVMA